MSCAVNEYKTWSIALLLIPSLWSLGLVPGRAIDVGPTISCDLDNQEYLDVSSLQCVQCDDGRYWPCFCLGLRSVQTCLKLHIYFRSFRSCSMPFVV